MKFTCTYTRFNRRRTNEITADTAEQAATLSAHGTHKAHWVQHYRDGNDGRDYQEFSVHEGRRVVATVRVYEVES